MVRRDSMAMKPFCGYNFADYWRHWLSFEGRVKQLPRIFHVNWFRQDKDGKFLWPGFGDNLRVLSWVIDRCEGRAKAHETPIGLLPHKEDLDLAGLDLPADALVAIAAGRYSVPVRYVGQTVDVRETATHYVIVDYVCEWLSGEPRAGSDAEALLSAVAAAPAAYQRCLRSSFMTSLPRLEHGDQIQPAHPVPRQQAGYDRRNDDDGRAVDRDRDRQGIRVTDARPRDDRPADARPPRSHRPRAPRRETDGSRRSS